MGNYMPTYEYECKTCHHLFEVFQNMSDAPISSCPLCGESVRRLINGGQGVIFKGSGFYVTDKNGNNKGTAKTSSEIKEKTPESAKTESVPSSEKVAG